MGILPSTIEALITASLSLGMVATLVLVNFRLRRHPFLPFFAAFWAAQAFIFGGHLVASRIAGSSAGQNSWLLLPLLIVGVSQPVFLGLSAISLSGRSWNGRVLGILLASTGVMWILAFAGLAPLFALNLSLMERFQIGRATLNGLGFVAFSIAFHWYRSKLSQVTLMIALASSVAYAMHFFAIALALAGITPTYLNYSYLAGTCLPIGVVVGVVLTVVDEAIQAQQARADAEHRFRVFLEKIPLAGIILDAGGRIQFCNSHLAELLDLTPEQLLNADWIEACVSPGSRATARQLLADQFVAQQHLPLSEEVAQDAHGNMHLISWTNMLIPSETGDQRLVARIGFDVTEQRQREQSLAEAQRLESLGRLAGGVAHDFNNLLTVINGYSDLILGTSKRQDPQWESLVEIRKAGGRAAELARQLLAFSRKQLIEPRPVILNSVIADSRNMIARLVGEDIDIVTDLDPEAGHVMADPGQLNQVLMNLVVNARDAMPSGGRLTLKTSRVRLDRDAAASLSGATAGPYVVMEVSDTGQGISQEVQQRLFEPFFTTKGEGKGTGLGLATVHGIVGQAGGWIRVESQPGMGATFRIGLPLLDQPGPQVLSDTPAPTRLEGADTVLVVEDHDDVRRFALAVLNSFGYPTLEASSGAEALLLAQNYAGPIDLLLTDVVMPQMTGKQLADRLRAVRPDMKVVYMSGYDADVISRQGVVDSGIEYIEKPFTPEALALKVRNILGESRSVPKVLVVDDEASIRGLFAKVLSAGGYKVTVACDGEQAQKVLQSGSFDLVIADLAMPNREGIETIQAIRASHPGLKIIAVSGAFGGSFLSIATKLGADATLVNPVSPEQLLETVRKTLESAARD